MLYEYVLSRGSTTERYAFSVFYDSAVPGVFTYNYTATGGSANQGATASVGIQGVAANGSEVGVQFSYDQGVVVPGLVVVCDTIMGTCINDTP